MVEFINKPGVRQMRRCLRNIEGIVNITQTPTGIGDQVALDFTIGFPFNPLVENQQRRGSISNSSLLIGRDNEVNDMTLRMPPVPADTFPKRQIKQTTEDIFPEQIGEADIMIHIEGGTVTEPHTEWWPHIELSSAFSAPSVSQVCDFMEIHTPMYLSGVRDKHNEFLDELNK
jgi:hypothetical protein